MIDWNAWGPVLVFVAGIGGSIGTWWFHRPREAADLRAVAVKTDIDLASSMQTQYAKLVADLSAEVDRRRALHEELRTSMDRDKKACQDRIAALEETVAAANKEREEMTADMHTMVLRIDELEARLIHHGLDANGAGH